MMPVLVSYHWFPAVGEAGAVAEVVTELPAVTVDHEGADVPFDCNTCPAVPAARKLVAPDAVL